MVDRERGWIMTNAHVASRSPSTIEIGFKDRDFIDAYKVYVDPYLDLAIIAMDPSFVPPVSVMPELDCGDLPRVGHPVGSFGHPWGLSFTGTRGIISGITSRFLQEDLQTDAPIHQETGRAANQPAARQDRRDQSATLEEKNAQNVNFALPMKYACKVLELLRAGKNPSPPELPVQFIKDVDERRELRVVNSFLDPEKLSLKSGDLILSIEGSDEKAPKTRPGSYMPSRVAWKILPWSSKEARMHCDSKALSTIKQTLWIARESISPESCLAIFIIGTRRSCRSGKSWFIPSRRVPSGISAILKKGISSTESTDMLSSLWQIYTDWWVDSRITKKSQ